MTYDLTNRLYAKKDVAREIAVVLGEPELLHRRARGAVRPAVSEQLHREAGDQLLAGGAAVPRLAERSAGRATSGPSGIPTAHALRSIAANANFSSGDWLNGSAGWSQRRFIPELPGFDDPNLSDQYINSTVNIRGSRNKFGGNYSFNYDVKNDRFLNQRWVAYYNSQCCGVGVEYQTFNLQGSFVQTNVSARPPLQHLVHAGRHRHLLEPVRRVRRAAEPLMTARSGLPLVTGAAGFAGGHLVEHLLEHEARVAAWGHGPVPAGLSRMSDRVSWASVDITDAEAVAAALAETAPVGGLPLRRDRRRAQHLVGLGDRAPRQRHRHAQPAHRARTPRARRAGADHRVGARLSARRTRRCRRTRRLARPVRTASASSRRSSSDSRRAAASSSRGRSTTRARGRRRPTSRPASRGRLSKRKPAFASRCWRSAISTRGATSPTCATRCAPTGC